jgi:acyl-coenzyme A thioesterase PaaI-like protein
MSLKKKLRPLKFKALEKFLTTPGLAKFHLLDPFVSRLIPFNAPHKFKIKSLHDYEIKIYLPLIRHNKNHLGTMHACAMATLGELSSGLLVVKHFSPANYRLIMKDLHASYTYQAKTAVHSKCIILQENIKTALESLAKEEQTFVELSTQIFDKEDNKVCEVKTKWQLKNWDYVKTL